MLIYDQNNYVAEALLVDIFCLSMPTIMRTSAFTLFPNGFNVISMEMSLVGIEVILPN